MMLPKLHIELEKWRYNIKYDIYVSSFGRLKDKNKKFIQPKVNSNGYLMYENKELVHRLVASTFIKTPGWGTLTVDHLDHNKRNNRISNLEWVSKEENLERAKRDLLTANKVTDFRNSTENIELNKIKINNIIYDIEDGIKKIVETPGANCNEGALRMKIKNVIANNVPCSYCGFSISKA